MKEDCYLIDWSKISVPPQLRAEIEARARTDATTFRNAELLASAVCAFDAACLVREVMRGILEGKTEITVYPDVYKDIKREAEFELRHIVWNDLFDRGYVKEEE
jgi:ribosomal protein S24E